MSAPRVLTAKLLTVHAAVLQEGMKGISLPDLRDKLGSEGITAKTLFQRLARLKAMNLVEQRGARSNYFALELADDVTLDGLRARCLALVDDCPRGVSDAVLAAELGLTESEVWRAMQPALKAGVVVRVAMPAAHGGGKGFAAGKAVAAPAPAPAATPAAAAVAQPLQGLPVEAAAALAGATLQRTQGQPGDAGTAFELLDRSRLAIAWDGARIVLPADVTRGLFRYLDALGGLDCSSQLQAGQGGAACA